MQPNHNGNPITNRGRHNAGWQQWRKAVLRRCPWLCVVLVFVLAGCTPEMLPAGPFSSSTPSLIPATGGRIEVREYPLVEQSTDNPVHIGFQQRVPGAVAAQRDDWRFPHPGSALDAANRALAAFDFRLEAASEPPFSSYNLLRGSEVVRSGIASFWPVSLKKEGGQVERDFLLPFVTLEGEQLVASLTGVSPWPGAASTNTAPVYYGDQIAYAETHAGQLAVYAGPSLLYSAPETSVESEARAGQPAEPRARSLYTWGGAPTGGEQHWALELEGRLIVDGKEINAETGSQESFGFSLLNNQPFYFSTREGITRLTYAGRTLPYIYDQVIHDQAGALNVFNPGANGRITWFYALRDGLWYYVEVGFFE